MASRRRGRGGLAPGPVSKDSDPPDRKIQIPRGDFQISEIWSLPPLIVGSGKVSPPLGSLAIWKSKGRRESRDFVRTNPIPRRGRTTQEVSRIGFGFTSGLQDAAPNEPNFGRAVRERFGVRDPFWESPKAEGDGVPALASLAENDLPFRAKARRIGPNEPNPRHRPKVAISALGRVYSWRGFAGWGRRRLMSVGGGPQQWG